MALPFDVYIIYAYVGVVCAIVIGIILNRTLARAFKDIADKKLITVFIFFIVFCFFDAFWGIVGSFIAKYSPITYEIFTYIFHLLAAASSFFISWYAVHYFKLSKKVSNIFSLIRLVIFVGQIVFLMQNIWTHSFFTIDHSGETIGAYHAGVLRAPSFYIQFAQYVPIAIYALIRAFMSIKSKNYPDFYFLGAFFLFIPFVFGVLQMLYPDGPFYSLGFAVFSVSIYSIDVTHQREKYLADIKRVETIKKSQNEIEKALNSVKEANNVKSQFLANMSHDIRTPINGILGLVELSKNENDVTKLKEYITKIDGTSKHLLSLVNDVLDMTLIENKKDTLINEKPCNVKTIVDNCYSIISGQIIRSPIYFKVEYLNECKNSIVYTDELRIRQILINILGNAIKFTNKGGVTLKVQELDINDEIVEYMFEISDTGIGMSKEFQDKLFDPFSQEHSNGRTKYQGTGLGMSITKELVDLLKGTISVESELNKGTTFKVKIPFKICKESIKKEETFDSNYSIKGLQILLVEDNELNLEIAQTILENNEAVIFTASNGQEALDKFKASKPGDYDLILMDIMMPIMNGYKATTAIRGLHGDYYKNVPIIAMTANAFTEDVQMSRAAGMNEYVSKPVDIAKLMEVLMRWL